MELQPWIALTYLVTTTVSVLLAGVLLRANPRRGINQAASLLVALCGIWQAMTGLIYTTPEWAAVGIRGVVALHGVAVAGIVTLLAALQHPAESLGQLVRRTVWVWGLAGVYAVPSFSPWFIPYGSTAADPRRGVLWYPYGGLQVLSGLFVLGVTVRAAWTLKGAARFTAQVVCGACGLLLAVMGLRLLLRPWFPAAAMPFSNAGAGLLLMGAFAYAVLTRRVFRARLLLLAVLFHGFALVMSVASACLVLRWTGKSEWLGEAGLYGGLIVALAVAGGLQRWRWRRAEWRTRQLGERLLSRFEVIRRRGASADGGLGEALDEVLEWTGARNGRILLRTGLKWADREVGLRVDDPLVVHLERHRWATTESVARTWRMETAVLAGLSLERLGGVIAVMSARGSASHPVMLVLGERVSGDYYSHQEIAALHGVVTALSAMIESREAGQRGRALGRIEALEMLGASIGHDFKQHLAAVRLLAHRLAERDLTPTMSDDYLGKLEQELDRLGEFSRRLTKLGQAAPGTRGAVGLGELFGDVVAFLNESATRHGVRVWSRLAEPAETVWANRSRLYQALVNLGLNAIEAMTIGEPGPAGRELGFVARRDGTGLVIEVADNGPGLPAEVLARLFDPFVTQGKAEGDGLGLYLTWDAVTREGGSIRYEANQPRGTRFILTLPH